MSFLTPKRTLGFKIEGTPYTVETLSANDFNIAAYNVSYGPEIPKKDRKLVRGDFSRDPHVTGKRSATVTFSVDMYHSGTNATPPNYFACYRACAYVQSIGADGVTLTTHADYTNVPATIEVVEKDEGTSPVQVVIKVKSCTGNAKIILDNVGEAIRTDFEFKGVLVSIIDRPFASILAPSGISTQVPDAVLNAGVTLFAEGECLNTFTIDTGNVVELFTCSSATEGYLGAHVVDRNPTLELDADLELIATRGDYARWTGNTTGPFLTTIGPIGRRITISAPAAQYSNAYQPGDREGHVTNNKTLELKRSSGNDELVITHGNA